MESSIKTEDIVDPEKMDQHANDFVQQHKTLSFSDMNYKKAVEESIDEFTRALFYVYREDKIEAHVDNLIILLLRGLLPPDKFLVFGHYPFQFWVWGDEKKSIH